MYSEPSGVTNAVLHIAFASLNFPPAARSSA